MTKSYAFTMSFGRKLATSFLGFYDDSEGSRLQHLPRFQALHLLAPGTTLTSGMTTKAPVITVSTMLIPNNHLRKMK